jgi:hypothetical protein
MRPARRRSQDGYMDSDDETSGETPVKSPERGFFGGSKEPDKGRKWDHARQGDPVILQAGVSSPWNTFVKSSMYGPALDEDGRRVNESFLEEQTPGYVQPWRGDVDGGDPEKALGLTRRKIRRRMWYQRIQVGTHKLLYLLQLTCYSMLLLCTPWYPYFSGWSFSPLQPSLSVFHAPYTTLQIPATFPRLLLRSWQL